MKDKKIIKVILLKSIIFIIFGIFYYLLFMESYFDSGLFGLLGFGIAYLLANLIYYHISKKTKFLTKRRNKIILIIAIIITSIVLLGTIFCIIDYSIAKNEKEPIFSEDRMAWIIANDNGGESEAIVYFGLGYKIVVCVFCEKSVYIMPFGIGIYPREYVDCINKKEQMHIQYIFSDGKLDAIDQVQTISIKVETDKESYETEAKDLNNTKGCFGELQKIDDTIYKMWKSCNLSEMSDADIQKVYVSDMDKLELTRKELIKLYKNNNKNMECELK